MTGTEQRPERYVILYLVNEFQEFWHL